MFRWFESRIDPFARTGIVMPPSALLSFYWHFVRPVWPAFALILFFDLLAAISEVLLATFLAQLIDLMKSAVSTASFFSDHAGLLVWMAFVILVARPTIIFVYELLKNQVLSPRSKPACVGRRTVTCCGKALISFRTSSRVGSPTG